jgi:hypothetical protein
MPSRFRRSEEEFELLRRSSSDSLDQDDIPNGERVFHRTRLQRQHWIYSKLPRPLGRVLQRVSRSYRSRTPTQLFYKLFLTFTGTILFLLVFAYLFIPSYTHLPEHYQALKRRCLSSNESGRGNVHNEKVFIASTLYDPGGQLLKGPWGKAVADLIDLLGPDNVYLSIYENDADETTRAGLEAYKAATSGRYNRAEEMADTY